MGGGNYCSAMTKAKPWPENDENARMEAVALAYRILRDLAPLDAAHDMTYAEIALRARDAQASAALIIQELNGARDGQKQEAGRETAP